MAKLAIADESVLVTEDKDFGELAFRDGYRLRGLIRLVPGYKSAEKAVRLCEVLLAKAGQY